MIALLGFGLAVPAVVEVSDLGALREAIARARPGTEIVVAPGRYEGRLFVREVRGAPGRPIVIRGRDERDPPVLVSAQFAGASHLVLSDLRFESPPANGVNVDDGERPGGARSITLRRIKVRGVPAGNHDGIKLSGVTDFSIEDCVVEGWGGSAVDLVGCQRGRIAGSRFSGGGASGIQIKGGSSDVRVVRCRFERAGARGVNLGGHTGAAYFRPRDARWEARGLVVEGCTFVGGEAPVAFVGVDGAVVRYNTFYRPERWALRILQETTSPGFVPCRNGRFERNLVVFSRVAWASGGVNVGPGTAPETFRFAENFWFCFDDPPASRPRLPTPERAGVYGLDPLLADPAAGDLTVRRESPARAYGAHAYPGEDSTGSERIASARARQTARR